MKRPNIETGNALTIEQLTAELNDWVNEEARNPEENREEAKRKIIECWREKGTALYLNMLGLTSLPEAIKKLEQLRVLNLDDNKLEQIPNQIMNLGQLRSLHLNNNLLTEISAADIKNLKNLQRLYLINNKITQLPTEILKPELIGLYIANNPIENNILDLIKDIKRTGKEHQLTITLSNEITKEESEELTKLSEDKNIQLLGLKIVETQISDKTDEAEKEENTESNDASYYKPTGDFVYSKWGFEKSGKTERFLNSLWDDYMFGRTKTCFIHLLSYLLRTTEENQKNDLQENLYNLIEEMMNNDGFGKTCVNILDINYLEIPVTSTSDYSDYDAYLQARAEAYGQMMDKSYKQMMDNLKNLENKKHPVQNGGPKIITNNASDINSSEIRATENPDEVENLENKKHPVQNGGFGIRTNSPSNSSEIRASEIPVKTPSTLLSKIGNLLASQLSNSSRDNKIHPGK